MSSRLYRSRTDRKITGLCGGLADWMNMDANVLRVLVIIITFVLGGAPILIYILASIVIPKDPYGDETYDRFGRTHGYDSYGRPSRSYGGPTFERPERNYRDAEYTNYQQGPKTGGAAQSGPSNIDDMMKDIEKKAMWKEIEELRAKVAQFEKQNHNETNNKEEK